MTSSLNLSGRVAVVTGASRGIGYFIAKELAAAGAHVVAVARTIGGLEELDDEIKAEKAISGKGEATLVPLDLADGAGVDHETRHELRLGARRQHRGRRMAFATAELINDAGIMLSHADGLYFADERL